MRTFKEYLIMENDDGFKAFEADVYREMQARGMDDPEWGIALQSLVRDAYENGADVEDVIMSLNYSGEEEMEQKMRAMDDTNRHFANQFDREVIQKRDREDISRSAVSNKRYNQRQSRDDRRYHGKRSEEEEAKLPAERDRRSAKGIEKLVKTVKNNAMPKSKRIGQMADRRNRSYYGD